MNNFYVFTKEKIDSIIKSILYLVFFIFLFLFARTNLIISKIAVNFWINSLIPSLLPFLLCTEILLNNTLYISNFFKQILCFIFSIPKEACISIITGYLFGFPNGAKSIIKLYDEKLISRNVANRLISFTNNCNPIFLISSIGISIFSDIYVGLLLVISHYLSSYIICVFSSFLSIIHYNEEKIYFNDYKFNIKTKLTLNEMILNSFNTLILILGFTMIFSIFANLICSIFNFNEVHKAFVYSILEMNTGVLKISKLCIPYIYKLTFISFTISFSSFNILFQIYTILQKYKFNFKILFISKFIQGILSGVITYILISNFPIFSSPYI